MHALVCTPATPTPLTIQIDYPYRAPPRALTPSHYPYLPPSQALTPIHHHFLPPPRPSPQFITPTCPPLRPSPPADLRLGSGTGWLGHGGRSRG